MENIHSINILGYLDSMGTAEAVSHQLDGQFLFRCCTRKVVIKTSSHLHCQKPTGQQAEAQIKTTFKSSCSGGEYNIY